MTERMKIVKNGCTFIVDNDVDGVNSHTSFVYHVKNNGFNGSWWVDDYHLVEAVITSPDIDAAVTHIAEQYLSGNQVGYLLSLVLVGIDLLPDEGTRVITEVLKSPCD